MNPLVACSLADSRIEADRRAAAEHHRQRQEYRRTSTRVGIRAKAGWAMVGFGLRLAMPRPVVRAAR